MSRSITSRCPYQLDPTGDTHVETARLRERGEVVRVTLPGGVEAWSTTTAAAARQALADGRLSKRIEHWTDYQRGTVGEGWALWGLVGGRGMLYQDGQDHQRIRALVGRAFTTSRVAALADHIRAVADDLLNHLADENGPVDLRQTFAYPLPVCVISRYLGVTDEMSDRMRGPFEALVTVRSPGEAATAMASLRTALHELVALRRREPDRDLVSRFILARDQDATFASDEELVDNLLLLISAGHETTVHLICNAALALLQHPDMLTAVMNGTHSWAAVVEEALRYASPVRYALMRYATEDLSIGGVQLRRGDAVIVGIAAGGYPADRADAFDLTRAGRGHHVAFGPGIHHCPGAGLARAEAEHALRAFFTRFPAARLAQEPTPLASIALQGVQSLHIHLDG
ncbi:cytochrome P450 [Streptomyces lydicus]|uniref:cytochrome P450 n=1 Tax=Streptomyces lydicus TaxID=47763 RepID=UPI0037A0C00D